MPRKTRDTTESNIYHVMVRGEGRQIIFEDEKDRLCFLRMLAAALDKCNARVFAWCLMENHAHLLLKVSFEEMPKLMQALLSGYACYYNEIHSHIGHLFSGRYKSEPVDTDEYLMTAVRYIHQNPVKGGLSQSCDYRWSSYRSYITGKGKTDTGFVLGVFGGIEAFIAFHGHDSYRRSLREMASSGKGSTYEEEKAHALAVHALGELRLTDVKALRKPDRDEAIARLRSAGLSVRQIERLTGIGRGIISRVKM